jgi:CRISPR type III-B/RAMP module RAMP protein Cmr6
MPIIGTTLEDSEFLWRATSQPVNKVLESVLAEDSKCAFNLGLYARKWNVFATKTNKTEDWLKCPSSDKNIYTSEKGKESETTRRVMEAGNNLLQIERRFGTVQSEAVKAAEQELERVHRSQERVLNSLRQQGYRPFTVELTLRTPLVHGLGESHPLEKFLTFDRNTGMPYLPSSSVKGVLKFRCMVGELNRHEAPEEQWQDGIPLVREKWVNEHYPLFQELFGTGDGKEHQETAVRGKLTFMDVFPKSVPRLSQEIMTPHYPDYYQSEGQEKGPTESQDPEPNAYLAVDSNQPFCFRFAAHPRISQSSLQTFLAVFSDESMLDFGFGSKTAIGMGQFVAQDVLGQERERQEAERVRKAEEAEAARIQSELAEKAQIEARRRESLGWSGRYLEDQDLSRGDEVLEFFEGSSLIPKGESISDPIETQQAQKLELIQTVCQRWEAQWTAPTHYQRDWLDRIHKLLPSSRADQAEAAKRQWDPEDPVALKRLASDDQFLAQLNKSQRDLFRNDAAQALGKKDFKEVKRKLNKLKS